jgi:hypothetical protein
MLQRGKSKREGVRVRRSEPSPLGPRTIAGPDRNRKPMFKMRASVPGFAWIGDPAGATRRGDVVGLIHDQAVIPAPLGWLTPSRQSISEEDTGGSRFRKSKEVITGRNVRGVDASSPLLAKLADHFTVLRFLNRERRQK